jgi:hypothetical protein
MAQPGHQSSPVILRPRRVPDPVFRDNASSEPDWAFKDADDRQLA